VDRYLLSTSAFRDLIKKNDNPVCRWFEEGESDYQRLTYISVISIGEIKSAILNIPPTDNKRFIWDNALDKSSRFFKQDQNKILEINLEIVDYWADLRLLTLSAVSEVTEKLESIGEDLKLILATAMESNMILVDPYQPYHDHLKQQGLRILDPYNRELTG